MFRGRYEHQLDAKGRLALPSAYRRLLEAGGARHLVVTTHIHSRCLVAYPPEEWAAFEARLAALPQFNRSVMLMRRLYVGNAMDCAIDKQGRMLVPPVHRTYAKLTREACWVGGIRTLEIWAKDAWQANVEAEREHVDEEVLERLGELGI